MVITYIQDQEIYQYKNDYYHSKSIHFFSKYLVGFQPEDKLVVLGGIIKVDDIELISKCKKITHKSIIYKKLPDFRKLSNLIKIAKLASHEVKKSDFCYLRCGIASSFAAITCGKYKIPYMSIVNEDVYKNFMTHPKLMVKLSAFPLWFCTRISVRNADYACYVTQEYLQKKYPNRHLHLGCSDVETLELKKQIFDKRLEKIKSYNEQVCIIGTAGSVEAFLKAHDIVIKALKILNQKTSIKFIYEIAGSGNPERLKELTHKLGVESQVRFLGQLSQDNILTWMDSLDIYVHPSRSEGLPRTIIEAISRAVPCICSNVGGVPELINHKFLFSQKNKYPENELAELLLKMNKNEMKKQAEVNFKNAYNYAPDKLQKKHDLFFGNAINYVRKNLN